MGGEVGEFDGYRDCYLRFNDLHGINELYMNIVPWASGVYMCIIRRRSWF